MASPSFSQRVDSRIASRCGCYHVTMTDNVRHSQTPPDMGDDSASLVTLDVVSSRFIAAGLPRSMRTLQRYCANGTLDAVKEATETGDTYFVRERSIATAITALKQLHDAKDRPRHAATERAMTAPVAPDEAAQDLDATDGLRPTVSVDGAEQRPERQPPTPADTSGYVAQLEERLVEKDEEIAFLREELVDRRGQIKDMKGIIDGQNQLLEAIQTNVAPIFKALAATVETQRIKLSPGKISERAAGARHEEGEREPATDRDSQRQYRPHFQDRGDQRFL
jgi:hypothetical protein